jgi:uncharacterized membrane protein
MKTKNNSAVLVSSSVVCLLPIILSLVLYADLPEQIAVHWSGTGSPDSFVPKSLAAFGLPFLFLAVNLFSKLRLYNDPKRANTSHVMQLLAAWTPPLLSLVLVPVTLFIALDANIPISLMVSVLAGVVLLVCGNYLPKSRQNYTIGIKLPWTLHNADNWNKTHRMAGYLYILGGIIIISGAFIFRGGAYLIILLAVAVFITVPVLYSYLLYRKAGNITDKND